MKETINFKDEKEIYISENDFKIEFSEDFITSLYERGWNSKGVESLKNSLKFNCGDFLKTEIPKRENL